jgi:hypothetical protein
MVKYKISKRLYNSDWNQPKCDSRFGCWSLKVKTVKVQSNINCHCCKGAHKETFYMCESHVTDLQKYLPKTTGIELKWDTLTDPIVNGLFIKPKS